MKIKIKFDKTHDAWIRAKLIIVDEEDFPTCEVFSGAGKPDIYAVTRYNYTTVTAENSEKIMRLINEILDELKNQLNKWRAVSIPSDYEVVI